MQKVFDVYIFMNIADGQKKKSADPLKLIGTRKIGVKRQLERLKKQQQKNKQVKLKKPDSSRGM